MLAMLATVTVLSAAVVAMAVVEYVVMLVVDSLFQYLWLTACPKLVAHCAKVCYNVFILLQNSVNFRER
jgi:hypothetical protein